MEFKYTLASVSFILLFGSYVYNPLFIILSLVSVYNSIIILQVYSGSSSPPPVLIYESTIAKHWIVYCFMTGCVFRVCDLFLFWVPFYNEGKLIYLFVTRNPGGPFSEYTDNIYKFLRFEVEREENNKIEYLQTKGQQMADSVIKDKNFKTLTTKLYNDARKMFSTQHLGLIETFEVQKKEQ